MRTSIDFNGWSDDDVCQFAIDVDASAKATRDDDKCHLITATITVNGIEHTAAVWEFVLDAATELNRRGANIALPEILGGKS